ncbi:LysR family transcriptional regulator [Peribacillus muralis]|uniref:cidABC operon transcriptional activator CidR n=1 Tax=Peribacillus muralis TaxID=264697 RepID=UPI001F4ECFBE|nr:LysR family transcriptional regulator [Peribacillus muralis]MCK1993903.1 LysR family transcriptional regulator [Peribacillus muralis]MCK2014458.1 LysR family transcriptional regulator [Peribacillus muralis]
MDIKHLQYFIEVTNFNNFTRAADHLYITQPAISKMIKNLETELGVELFDRSRKQLVLTDAGRVVLEQAKLIDKAFRNLETEVDNLLGLKKGHIRIGLPPIIDASFFPQILSRFHEEYPQITFQLVEDGSKKIEESVQKDQLDIGVIVLPTKTALFHHFSFLEENINLIVHPSHPFACREEIDLAELENESFILFNKDYVLRDLIISSCNEAGFTPHIVTESSRWDFIEEMVYCKLGIALLPESLCRHDERVQTVKVKKPSINWKLGFIWSKDHYLSYAAKEWLKYTTEALTNKE